MSSISKKAGAGWVFLLCVLAYSVAYIGRHNIETCVPVLVSTGIITESFNGIIMAVYKLTYAVGQLVNGIIGCKVSPKYMVGIGLLGSGAVNVLTGWAPSGSAILIFWMLNGYFQSMLWAPILRAFAEWMPDQKHSYNAGINISLAVPIGTVSAYLIPAFIFRFFDENWRAVFISCGITVLLTGVFWFIGNIAIGSYISETSALRIKENQAALPRSDKSDSKPEVSLIKVLLAPGLLLAVLCMFFDGALKDSVSDWAPTFIGSAYNLSASGSALAATLIPLVSIGGTYAASWINEKFTHNEFYTCAVLFALSVVCTAVLLPISGIAGIFGAIITTFLLGISVSAMWGVSVMLTAILPYRYNSTGRTSAVSGFLNCCSYVAAALSTVVYGLLIEKSQGSAPLIILWSVTGLCGLAVCFISGKYRNAADRKRNNNGNL